MEEEYDAESFGITQRGGRGTRGGRGGRGGRGRGRGRGADSSVEYEDGGEGFESGRAGRGGRGGRGRGEKKAITHVDWSDKKKAKQVFEKKKGAFGIEISNFEKESTRAELIAFLNKQVGCTWSTCELVTGATGYPVLNITVMDKKDVNELLSLNGKPWKKRILTVKPMEVSAASSPQQPKIQNQLLGHYVEQCYNARDSFLNLNNLNTSAETRCNCNSYSFLQILWKILAEKCPGVKTLAFGYNGVNNLKGFATIQDYCPNIMNLSLEGNQLSDNLKGVRLRELLLMHNPIASMANYHRFPSLRYLDKCRTKPLIQFNLPQHVINTSIPNIHGSYFDAQDHHDLIVEWAAMYINLYDNKEERINLIDVYDITARLSISLAIPQEDKKKSTNKSSFGRQTGHSIKFYEPFNRNLLQVFSAEERQKFLKSNADIVSFIKNMPATKHALGDLVIDSHLLYLNNEQVLSVTMHGIFWEILGPAEGVNRNFSRVFLLKPAPANSPAALKGWKAVITNELFTIHEYCGHLPNTEDTVIEGAAPNITTTTTTTATSLLNSNLTLTGDLFTGLTTSAPFGSPSSSVPPTASLGSSASFGSAEFGKKKYEAITKFCGLTNLKEQYAEAMLEAENWDYQSTVYKFMVAQEKGEIPKEYYKISAR